MRKRLPILVLLLLLASCSPVGKAGYAHVDFYYTYAASTDPPHYQRYRFYEEDGQYYFYHETRDGGGWPQTEEDITVSGTIELTEEDWQIFLGYLEGGTAKKPKENVTSGDAGPWTYLYRGNGQEEFSFPSPAALHGFEEYCRMLASV